MTLPKGTWKTDPRVVLQRVVGAYPVEPPYHPSQAYPEAPFPELSNGNNAYAAVRQSFIALGLDRDRIGFADWNPLGELIRPGDRVLLKPNLIRESHQHRSDQWEQIITHGSIIRAVLDYVWIASRGDATVTIADGPQTDSDFDTIRARLHLDEIAAVYQSRGLRIQVIDLRRDRWFQVGDVIERRTQLTGDPHGYVTVDLGEHSEFVGRDTTGRLYGADYDMDETAEFHGHGRHAYVLCRTALEADVFINLPKLKTHKKVGVTLSLKNLVGINGYRNSLPHHTIGTYHEGGDEFEKAGVTQKIQSRAIVAFKRSLVRRSGKGGAFFRAVKRGGRLVFGDTQRVVRSGNWHGNDTTWRMVLDLNKILFNFTADGTVRDGVRYLSIVDGLIGGDGDGPTDADPRPVGLLAVGFNPVAVDTVCAAVMGFEPTKITLLREAWHARGFPLVAFGPGDIKCVSNVDEWNGDLNAILNADHLGFHPHFGWRGSIERTRMPQR